MLKFKTKKRGFTLIELIAVIAITAVLAAAFTPKLSGYIDQAKKVSVLDQAKKILTAYEYVNLKSPSLSESSKISNVISLSTGLVTSEEITKIPLDFTVEQCRNILNSEKYDFTISDGKATNPFLISN